jgi:hypothetical protein
MGVDVGSVEGKVRLAVMGRVRLAVMGRVSILVELVRLRLVALEGRSHAVCFAC